MSTSLSRALKVNCTTTLFFARLGNLKPEDLKAYCEQFGPVKDVSIIYDPETQKSKGCGFVKFMTHEGAQRCLQEAPAVNQTDPVRRYWVVEWAKSSQIKETDLDKTTIYVTGLSVRNSSEACIRGKFGIYGEIEKVTVVDNAKGVFAFVKFRSMESAAAAINEENGKSWCGNLIVVEFSETIQSKRSRRQKATLKKQSQQPRSPRSTGAASKQHHPPPTHRASKSSTFTAPAHPFDAPAGKLPFFSQTSSPALEHESPLASPPALVAVDDDDSLFDTELQVFRDLVAHDKAQNKPLF